MSGTRRLHVAVGSANPVKVAAVRAVVRHLDADAIIDHVAVASGVPDQPWGDDETIQGARTRAIAARAANDADIGVGIEGGVVDAGNGDVRSCAWSVIAMRDGRTFTGGSLAMPLPQRVAQLVRSGVELGHAMDQVTQSSGTKHGAGAVGILTNGIIDRQRAYEIILTYAFAPLLASAFWGERSPSESPSAHDINSPV